MAALDDVFRAACRMYGPLDQDIMNIWHVQITNYVGGDDQDVADELNIDLSTKYGAGVALFSTAQGSTDISVVNVTTSAVLGSAAWSTPWVGTVTGENLPPQVSTFSWFRTGFSRRIGRKFWGIVTEPQQDNGVASGGLGNAIGLMGARFIGTFVGGTTGNTYVYGVYNENKSPQFLPFTEILYTRLLRTQRRRVQNVGS